MSDWQPGLYLEFGKERTQPSIDLAAKITVENPKRIIDVGCGPGNSSAVLKARWQNAEITGLDNSKSMIDEAKAKYPSINWVYADASGDLSGLGKFDVAFSNAAIQWMPEQEKLLANLFGMLNKGGVFAAQIPCVMNMPVHIELTGLAESDKWKEKFKDKASSYEIHAAEFYYDILCGLTSEIDLWETRYFHIMNTHADIVKWFSASGLRPYLDCLRDKAAREEFLSDYESALKKVYPKQADGRILFPFTRIFFTAVNTVKN